MEKHHFLETLIHLREKEELMLFSKLYPIHSTEEKAVIDYLLQAHQLESLEYPHQVPPFDEAAALWAAKTVYHASQLLINREKPPTALKEFFPTFPLPIQSSSILSADLTLRFLPIVLQQAEDIDPEDQLIDLLEQILVQWHYSSIGYLLKEENLNFESVLKNACLLQLYVNRIIEKKADDLAQKPQLQKHIKSSLGDYKELLWQELSFV